MNTKHVDERIGSAKLSKMYPEIIFAITKEYEIINNTVSANELGSVTARLLFIATDIITEFAKTEEKNTLVEFEDILDKLNQVAYLYHAIDGVPDEKLSEELKKHELDDVEIVEIKHRNE